MTKPDPELRLLQERVARLTAIVAALAAQPLLEDREVAWLAPDSEDVLHAATELLREQRLFLTDKARALYDIDDHD